MGSDDSSNSNSSDNEYYDETEEDLNMNKAEIMSFATTTTSPISDRMDGDTPNDTNNDQQMTFNEMQKIIMHKKQKRKSNLKMNKNQSQSVLSPLSSEINKQTTLSPQSSVN